MVPRNSYMVFILYKIEKNDPILKFPSSFFFFVLLVTKSRFNQVFIYLSPENVSKQMFF